MPMRADDRYIAVAVDAGKELESLEMMERRVSRLPKPESCLSAPRNAASRR